MITRLAPSPTGDLHLGHARAFLAAWALARSQGGSVRLRIEDLDAPRMLPGSAERQVADLEWLGLDWDGPIVYQSQRGVYYKTMIERLARQGRVFACYHSRSDVARAATAPHGPEGVPPYPASLRPAQPLSVHELATHPDAALRFWVPEGEVQFTDLLQGPQLQDVAAEVGDFVLRRRDKAFAYQLAVVADDWAQGVTHVVRGADLLYSTARQIQVYHALGATMPVFAHVGLALNAAGEKLSKRDEGTTLAQLREAGYSSEKVIGKVAASLGIGTGTPMQPDKVAAQFTWHPVAAQPYRFSL